jgi:hypothetical protein
MREQGSCKGRTSEVMGSNPTPRTLRSTFQQVLGRGLVYGVASALTDLVTFGMAMCVTYYLSGGNLLVPAVIHGAYDATGFLGVATSSQIGTVLRVLMMLIGIVVALSLFINRIRKIRSAAR